MKNQLKNLIIRFYSSGNAGVFSADQIPVKHGEEQYALKRFRRKYIDLDSQPRSCRTNTNLY